MTIDSIYYVCVFIEEMTSMTKANINDMMIYLMKRLLLQINYYQLLNDILKKW